MTQEKLIDKLSILINGGLFPWKVFKSIQITDWSINNHTGKIYPEFLVELDEEKYDKYINVHNPYFYWTDTLSKEIEKLVDVFMVDIFVILRANIKIKFEPRLK